MDRLRLAGCGWALLFWSLPAQAATVAIVRPVGSSPELHETLSRLHGELLSVGLEVELANLPGATRGLGATALRASVEGIAAARGACAVIDIVGDRAPFAVDVWVIEKSPRWPEVTRVVVEPNTTNAPERLAIRAIEVLRSNFLEIDLAARGRRRDTVEKPATTNSAAGEVNRPASHPERIGIEAGAAVLTGVDRVGPALLPLVRIGWAARPRWVVQATVAALGSQPTVATTAGSARVAQQYGVLGGCYRFRVDQRLRPFLALSAGVLRTSVEGQALPPEQGHSKAEWSFLAEGSLGVGLQLSDRYYLSLAAHAQLAAPYVAIRFLDQIVATSGRPNLLLTLTVGAWL